MFYWIVYSILSVFWLLLCTHLCIFRLFPYTYCCFFINFFLHHVAGERDPGGADHNGKWPDIFGYAPGADANRYHRWAGSNLYPRLSPARSRNTADTTCCREPGSVCAWPTYTSTESHSECSDCWTGWNGEKPWTDLPAVISSWLLFNCWIIEKWWYILKSVINF